MHTLNFALEVGRFLQKKQTGFIHYCHQSEDLTTHDTIPILENALFALSLFRSRLSDNVLEGKGLIEKLLKFEVKGNFPTYLHAYPQVADPYLGLRLLPIFFWITVDFGHVIGTLKEELQRVVERIVSHFESLTALPKWAVFRLQGYQGQVGSFPFGVHDWGEGLISLQLAEKRGADITEALEEAFKFWHPELSLYTGPAYRRNQVGYQPETTLFDLFMCQWFKNFSNRVSERNPVHLYGALIRPFSSEPVAIAQATPFVHFNAEDECPLFIAWNEHTFVLAKQNLRVEGNEKELLLYLKEDEEEGSINFFFNHQSDHEIFVNGEKATAFQQEDQIEICSKGLSIHLSFSAEDGIYTGHLLRGNRPSQHLCRGANLFTAYDWRLAIRTVRLGKNPIRVRLHLLEQKRENQPLSPFHAIHCQHTESPQ